MPHYRRLLPCLVLLLLAVPASADEKEGAAPQRIATEDGDFSLAFPGAWTVTDKRVRPNGAKLIGVTFEIPGHEEQLIVSLFRINGAHAPLQQALTEREVLFHRHSAQRAVVNREPHPHLELDFAEDDRDLRLVHSYAVVEGNTFSVAAEGPRTLWPAVRTGVLELIGSLKAKVKPYPAIPKGYAVDVRDDITYYIHDDAKAKDVDAYHKVLRKRRRAFEKRHGRITFDEQSPVSIVFHNRPRDAIALSKEAAESESGQSLDAYARRLFAIPVRKDKGAKLATLYLGISGFLFRARYGALEPDWLYQGETLLAHSEGTTGKPLPHASKWLKDQSPAPDDFEDLLLYEARDREDAEKYRQYRKTCALYVAMFRHGPRKCRTAFKKFLTALDEDGDWEAAVKTHIFPLGREVLYKAAAKYLEKMKSK